MAEQDTPKVSSGVNVDVEDRNIYTFLTTTVGKLSKAGYHELVTRLFAYNEVTPYQKGALVVRAIHGGHHEYLAVLLSLGIGFINGDGVVQTTYGSYALGVIFTAEVAKILVESMLDMTDAQFEHIKRYYRQRPADINNFTSLYQNFEGDALARFFVRVNAIPKTGLPLPIMALCGRSDVYGEDTKDFVMSTIEILDDYGRISKELTATKTELASANNAITEACYDINLIIGSERCMPLCEPRCEKCKPSELPLTEQLETTIVKLAACVLHANLREMSTNGKLETALADLEAANRALKESTAIRCELVDSAALQCETLSKTSAELFVTHSELTDAKAALADTQADITKTKNKLARSKGKRVSLSKLYADHVHGYTADLARMQQKYTDDKDAIKETYERLIDAATQQIAVKDVNFAKSQAELSESKADIAETKTELNKTNEKLAQTQVSLTESEKRRAEYTAMLDKADSSVVNALERINEKQQCIDDLKEKITYHVAKTDEHKLDIDLLERKLVDKQAVLDMAQKNLMLSLADNGVIAVKLAEEAAAHSQAEQRIHKLRQDLDAVKAELAAAVFAHGETEGCLHAVRQDLDAANGKLSGLRSIMSGASVMSDLHAKHS